MSMDTDEVRHLRELNLNYLIRMTTLEQDYKKLERSKLLLEHKVSSYIAKEKEDEIRTENYAALRVSLDQMTTCVLDKRSKNIELQRLLFDSRKELASVRYQLEESRNTSRILEKQLEFVHQINSKPENHKIATIPENESSSNNSSINVTAAPVAEKSPVSASGRVGDNQDRASPRPIQNRLLENARRQDRKSQSLESLSTLGRRVALFGGAAAASKQVPKGSNSSLVNKVTKSRPRQPPVTQPKAPHCGPGSRPAIMSIRYPCGTNNGQVSNKSISSNKSVSILSNKSQCGLAPVNSLKSKATMNMKGVRL